MMRWMFFGWWTERKEATQKSLPSRRRR